MAWQPLVRNGLHNLQEVVEKKMSAIKNREQERKEESERGRSPAGLWIVSFRALKTSKCGFGSGFWFVVFCLILFSSNFGDCVMPGERTQREVTGFSVRKYDS